MFKIGEFARMTQVSVKALRLYDEMGLLKPAQVDRFTDYRYYSADQLPRLHRIIALKGLGFTLEQVNHLLDERISAEQIRGMLMMKRAEAEQDMLLAHERLMAVEARLRLIEGEGKMTAYEVLIKKVPDERVAGAKTVVPNYENMGGTFDKLFGEAYGFIYGHGAHAAGPSIAVYYDDGSMQNVPVEAAVPIGDAPLQSQNGVQVHTLPGTETMASTLHTGAFTNVGEAYDALMKWVEANGYRMAGPAREVYLAFDRDDPSKNVTEIQIPVVKA